AHSRQNAFLLGNDGAGSALAGIDTSRCGRVARGAIFQERVFDDRGNSSAMPVQKRVRPVRFSVVVTALRNLIIAAQPAHRELWRATFPILERVCANLPPRGAGPWRENGHYPTDAARWRSRAPCAQVL